MNKKSLLFRTACFVLFVFSLSVFSGKVQAQVTTSSISGRISAADGEYLPGATVSAVHEPTGTQYGTVTSADGSYNLSNLRVGGPYSLTVSFVGFTSKVDNGITLQLGEKFVYNVTLAEEGKQLQEIVITSNSLLNDRKTGASTNVSRQQLESLPTISRSLQDFTRLTPQVNGSSFGGSNNRYNNITIDGAVNNDVFGLGNATPGSQANTQPISLDAIQELQVVLAPYDVTLGNFTGGGVNAVTRSGSNKFEGSAYYFGRNQNIIGKNVLTDQKSDFKDMQYGFRVGGPLIKNKLFFFVNAESGRRSAPLANNAGENGSAITIATAQRIADYTLRTYGYDVGGYGPTNAKTENNKILAKLDWNINSNNQITLRHNYIKAFDDNISRSGTLFRFGNNAYKFNNTQNITVLELRSKLTDRLSNNLILGYSRIRDSRQVEGSLFPQITITNVDGISANSAEFGSQRSSTANELDQDIFEITDNVKLTAGKHLFTFGTHNEFFKFRNLFINNLNGRWDFTSVDNYLNNVPARVRATYSQVAGDNRPASQFNAMQLGFYVQDEFEAFKGFKVTAGLRLDVPIIPDKPLRNELVEQSFPGYRTDETPSGKLLVSPRVGFNYDVKGDRSIQLRGGVGIFTGRVPFVWLSNQFTNSGKLFGTVDARTTGINGGKGFEPDVEKQKGLGPAGSTAEINLVSPDFKIPQVLRYNLAGDFKLPGGIVATLEGIYSKTLNNIVYSDLNRKASTGTLNPELSGGADTRPVFAGGKVNPAFTNVILLENSNKGYTYTLTAQLQKRFFNGINSSIAYTYGKAKSVNDGASSTALSNWEFVQVVNDANNPPLTYSVFDLRHRVIGSLGYTFKYGKNKLSGTGFNIFYVGRSGSPFSFVNNSSIDLNSDGAFSNDLIFIPASQSQIKLKDVTVSGKVVTAAEQWTNLDAFIKNNEYLNANRGKYAERNGSTTPWENHFDLRLVQDIGIKVGQRNNVLQVTFDIFNFTNLLNKDWGRSYVVTNDALGLLNPSTTGYTFTSSNKDAWNVSDLSSRWQAQVGLRYTFN